MTEFLCVCYAVTALVNEFRFFVSWKAEASVEASFKFEDNTLPLKITNQGTNFIHFPRIRILNLRKVLNSMFLVVVYLGSIVSYLFIENKLFINLFAELLCP